MSAPFPPPTTMSVVPVAVVWEYLVDNDTGLGTAPHRTKWLNGLGQNGWELIDSASLAGGSRQYTFKRPVRALS